MKRSVSKEIVATCQWESGPENFVANYLLWRSCSYMVLAIVKQLFQGRAEYEMIDIIIFISSTPK